MEAVPLEPLVMDFASSFEAFVGTTMPEALVVGLPGTEVVLVGNIVWVSGNNVWLSGNMGILPVGKSGTEVVLNGNNVWLSETVVA
jgi:hypothetical protein